MALARGLPRLHSARAGGALLRKLMGEKAPLALIGCPNAQVGREVVRAGFSAAYVSGYVTAMNAGMPDIGLVSREGICRRIQELQMATGLPVVADADTGFGEPEAVYLTVHEYARAGCAGFHIEDQVFPKRCGHLLGKQVVPMEEAVKKIEAAVAARASCLDPDMVIIARSDAKAVEGFEATKARCKAYAEAGADALFPEACSTLEEFAEFVEAMQGVRTPSGHSPYFIANMTEFGATRRIALKEFGEAGYHGVIFPATVQRAQQYAARKMIEAIAKDGHVANGPHMLTQAEELALSKYKPGVEWHYPSSGSTEPEHEEMPGAWSGWFEGDTSTNIHKRK
eukprot:TRINITY_DN53118_c0_g1_i1.p1 TRINITY_DN53118_c0_g1~~TRINITY_DN53118_c0_g1_i1.p1  ORF type:complete len:357 (-),score=82.67 TRINITY_DN53118_c0_g1_i1:364-1383(-)